MKNILYQTRLLLSVAIALLIISAKADKVALKYNLTVGNTYKTKTLTDQVMEQSIMGQQQTIKNRMEGITAFKVQGVEGNTIVLDTWYEKLTMSVETPMGNFMMDSDKPDDTNPGSKVLSKLMNKHFTIKMAINGEIIDVIGSDTIMEDAFNEISSANNMQISIIKERVKQFVKKESLKGSLEIAIRCFPDKPVSIGDTWTNQLELVSIMPTQINNTWKLTDIKEGVSFLECKSTLKSKEDSPAQNMNGIQIKYNITGEQQTVSKIDEKTGWVIESTMNQEISGEIIADLSAQGGGNQKFPITMKSKTIITGIK